jgi:hypothetical protein
MIDSFHPISDEEAAEVRQAIMAGWVPVLRAMGYQVCGESD